MESCVCVRAGGVRSHTQVLAHARLSARALSYTPSASLCIFHLKDSAMWVLGVKPQTSARTYMLLNAEHSLQPPKSIALFYFFFFLSFSPPPLCMEWDEEFESVSHCFPGCPGTM